MSDIQKKLKIRYGKGWEEAGGEFYQETFGVDCEGLPKYTTSNIATLLPSKKNRNGNKHTVKREKQEMKMGIYWKEASTVTKSENVNDAQIDMLPDLSQVFPDEKHIWKEILHIKLMPINMQQKKDMKSTLDCSTKLRLQGFNQLKWKNRKTLLNMRLKLSNVAEKFKIWESSLKHIEGRFGTGVLTYFIFMRWMFFVNCLIFLSILLIIVLPYLYIQNSFTQQCSASSNCSSYLNEAKEYSGNMYKAETSALFYGFYSTEIYNLNLKGFPLYYDLPLAYFSGTMFSFLLCLILILKAAVREFKNRFITKKLQFYQYCNILFGGWDYCLHNTKTGQIKHAALYNEIKYINRAIRFKMQKRGRTKNDFIKLILIRILINIIVLSIIIFCAAIVLRIFSIAAPYKNAYAELQNTTRISNDELVSSNNSLRYNYLQIDFYEILAEYSTYIKEFVPFISIVICNKLLPSIFNYLSRFERYAPLFEIKISILRTLATRGAFVAIITGQFFSINLTYACWETYMGQQFMRLILTEFLCHFIVVFFINFPRGIWARNSKHDLVKFLGNQEFVLSKNIIDIVYLQAICWLGTFYAPLLPMLTTFIFFLMFHIKRFQCLVNSKPSPVLFGASRTYSLFMIILLISFFACMSPIMYAIAEISPSPSCGPFLALKYVWQAPLSAFMQLPKAVKDVIFFLGSSQFAVPMFIFLILSLYYYYTIADASKNMINILRNQLVLEGQDKQFLLTRLSGVLKQYQDLQQKYQLH